MPPTPITATPSFEFGLDCARMAGAPAMPTAAAPARAAPPFRNSRRVVRIIEDSFLSSRVEPDMVPERAGPHHAFGKGFGKARRLPVGGDARIRPQDGVG